MQKCKELGGQQYDYSDGLLIGSAFGHKIRFMEPLSQKTSPFRLVPHARDALWYAKHSDIDVIDVSLINTIINS